jgi:hypothetical protein
VVSLEIAEGTMTKLLNINRSLMFFMTISKIYKNASLSMSTSVASTPSGIEFLPCTQSTCPASGCLAARLPPAVLIEGFPKECRTWQSLRNQNHTDHSGASQQAQIGTPQYLFHGSKKSLASCVCAPTECVCAIASEPLFQLQGRSIPQSVQNGQVASHRIRRTCWWLCMPVEN